MDNGLIFPYPRRCAHAEPGDAKHATPDLPSGGSGRAREVHDGLLRECRSFGGVLEPRYIVGAESLDQ